ncbi:hypothetical protein KR009_002930, partial [Drosophila setifemur]
EFRDTLYLRANRHLRRFRQKMALLKELYYGSIGYLSSNVIADPKALAQISQARGWKTAPYRYIGFHPNSPNLQIALLTKEDRVLLYDGRRAPPVLLTSCEQKDATCVAFRPWASGCELAVGCEAGICLWRANKLSVDHQIRPMQGTHYSQMLKGEGHCYVTSLQWNEDGTILVSAALGTGDIILWEPDCHQKLRLLPGPGNQSSFSLLCFSPDFHVLFCARSDGGGSICQLDRSNWSPHQVLPKVRLQTVAWTGGCSQLLFAQKACTFLYSCTSDQETGVFLRPEHLWGVELIADLRDVTTCSGEYRYCGEPQTIVTDPLGIYLAVIFKEQSFVLFGLLVKARGSPIRFFPLDFIDCDMAVEKDAEIYPTCMDFTRSQSANPKTRWLVVCWNISHIQWREFGAQSLQEAIEVHNLN